jgi:DNA polymerase-3 subunit gamma/tau
MSTSIYRTYRPQTFSDIIGQQHIVQTLSNAILHNRIGHAYLFTGPRGTGKTTMARILAKAINCLENQADKKEKADPCNKCIVCNNINEGKSLDIFEIDAASNTGVDNIRELRENVKFPPSQAKFKVYIIDEVHMLSTGAFNALLKTLEEPPAHVIFILATTEIHKVPQTIISRCQRFDFSRLSLEFIIQKLSLVAKSEKIKIEKEALEMIAIASEGGMRDAESLLSQVISLEDKNITPKEVQEILGTTERIYLEKFAETILKKELEAALLLIDTLSKDGFDLEIFHKMFLNYLRQLLLITVSTELVKTFSFELTGEQQKDLLKQAEGHTPQEIVFILDCYSEIIGKIKSSFIPQLPLEIATVKAIKEIKMQILENTPTEKPILESPTPINYYTPKISELPTKNQEIKEVSIPIAEQPTQIKTEKTAKETTTENMPAEVSLPNVPTDFSISDAKKNWGAICAEIISKNHSLATILPSTTIASLKGSTITIATKFPFHKDKLKEVVNQLTVENAFAKILGFAIRISPVTMEEIGIKAPSPILNNNPSEKIEEKPSETSSLLSDAMGIMGGSIVE